MADAVTTTRDADDWPSALRLGVMRLARRLRVERDGNDLTFNQLAALGTLRRHGPLPIGELAAHENVKPPSMTRTVAALEDAGLVTRRPSDTDGRQVVVELTDARRRGPRRRPGPPHGVAGRSASTTSTADESRSCSPASRRSSSGSPAS